MMGVPIPPEMPDSWASHTRFDRLSTSRNDLLSNWISFDSESEEDESEKEELEELVGSVGDFFLHQGRKLSTTLSSSHLVRTRAKTKNISQSTLKRNNNSNSNIKRATGRRRKSVVVNLPPIDNSEEKTNAIPIATSVKASNTSFNFDPNINKGSNNTFNEKRKNSESSILQKNEQVYNTDTDYNYYDSLDSSKDEYGDLDEQLSFCDYHDIEVHRDSNSEKHSKTTSISSPATFPSKTSSSYENDEISRILGSFIEINIEEKPNQSFKSNSTLLNHTTMNDRNNNSKIEVNHNSMNDYSMFNDHRSNNNDVSRGRSYSTNVALNNKNNNSYNSNNIYSNNSQNNKKSKKKNLSFLGVNTPEAKQYAQYEQRIEKSLELLQSVEDKINSPSFQTNGDGLVESLINLSSSSLHHIDILINKSQQKTRSRSRSLKDKFLQSNSQNNDFTTFDNAIDYISSSLDLLEHEYKLNQKNSIKPWNGIYVYPVSSSLDYEVTDRQWMTNNIDCSTYSPIGEHISSIIRENNHPFGSSVATFIDTFKCNFCEEERKHFFLSSKSNFSQIRSNLLQFCSQLLNCLIKTYYILDLTQWQNEIYETILDFLLTSLHDDIFPLYKLYYRETDNTIDQIVEQLQCFKSSPEKIGVAKQYCIYNCPDNLKDGKNEWCMFPEPSRILSKISEHTQLSSKIVCIASSIRCVCSTIEKYYNNLDGSSVSIGADDLLPLYIYVFISSGLTHVYSQCKYLDDFISDEISLGEHGYALATFEAAIHSVKTLDISLINSDVKSHNLK